jgi:predicted nucleotidyltransferase
MHPEIADKRDALIALCKRYDVARLEVFGSAARGVDFDPAVSDADFLVEFKPESTLAPLELVEPAAIKNPFIRARINRSREVLYGS